MANKFDLRKNVNKLIEYALNDPERPMKGPNYTKRNLQRVVGLNFLFFGGFYGFFCFGVWIKELDMGGKNNTRPPFRWATPKFLGNTVRAPLFPYKYLPYETDYEELLKFWR